MQPWLGTFAALTVATLVALVIHGLGFTEANLVMVYLLAVVAVAARCGALPAVAALVISILFETFYRGADAKPDRRGTGLGLAICKAIIQAHGGTIEARNRNGGGTVIRFTIPHDDSPPVVDLVAAEVSRQ